MERSLASPVVLTAAAFYAAFTLAGLALHDWNPLWFVWIGERFSNLEPNGRTGYDGQFIYYLARDGWAALPHIDNPPYRLQRILYALLARWLSFGNATALPWVMVAINAAAIIAATALITRRLIAQGMWRWYGLVYPLFVGTLMAYSRDLTEPLACALALGGVLCWLDERRAAAAALLALASLARETSVLFIAGLALAELTERRWTRLVVLGLAAVPLLTWHLYLRIELGAGQLGVAGRLSFIPTASMFSNLSPEPGRLSALLFIGLPTIALAPAVLRLFITAPRDPIAWLVAVHWMFALIAPPGAHLHVFAISRQTAALLLTLLLAFPRCPPALRAAIAVVAIAPTLLWLPPLLWWAPWTATV
jgi:hypothetical protein